jgi:hypothetical protein
VNQNIAKGEFRLVNSKQQLETTEFSQTAANNNTTLQRGKTAMSRNSHRDIERLGDDRWQADGAGELERVAQQEVGGEVLAEACGISTKKKLAFDFGSESQLATQATAGRRRV